MHPPTSLKVTILAEKSAPISNKSAPFRDASPPTSLNVANPAEKSQSILVKTFFFLETTWFWTKKSFEYPISAEKSLSILVKTFFFFFFGDHLLSDEKLVWNSDFGRKIALNFGEDLFFFLETTWFWTKKSFEFPISAEKSLSILVKKSECLRFCA